ncbi:MAG TPA: hypothetical protein PKE62_13585 [Anaerolineales bacterium]|nr:hypothetical protein [Anaerolineales bacterium]
MKKISHVFIAVTDGEQRLEISGTLDLLKKFMGSVNVPSGATIYNPALDLSDEVAAKP